MFYGYPAELRSIPSQSGYPKFVDPSRTTHHAAGDFVRENAMSSRNPHRPSTGFMSVAYEYGVLRAQFHSTRSQGIHPQWSVGNATARCAANQYVDLDGRPTTVHTHTDHATCALDGAAHTANVVADHGYGKQARGKFRLRCDDGPGRTRIHSQ